MLQVRRASITKCRHCPGEHWIVRCWRQPDRALRSRQRGDFNTHAAALKFAIERTGQ